MTAAHAAGLEGRLTITLPGGAAVDEVSTFMQQPLRGATAKALLVLAHGAGADMRHRTMQAIADALCDVDIATLRCNFPFKEHGRARVDDVATAVATLVAAVTLAQRLLPGTPLLLGGHSFGGRMASHAAAQGLVAQARGLVFCAFPLHTAGKPAVTRAKHLPQIPQPMLFLSGTRDALATPSLLSSQIETVGDRARLHWLHDADHSYAVRQRERVGMSDVFVEMATAARAWFDEVVLRQ